MFFAWYIFVVAFINTLAYGIAHGLSLSGVGESHPTVSGAGQYAAHLLLGFSWFLWWYFLMSSKDEKPVAKE